MRRRAAKSALLLAALPLFAVLLLFSSGCARQTAPESAPAPAAGETADAPQTLIAVAHTQGGESPLQKALDEADRELRRASEGRMAFVFYPDAQIGDDTEILSYIYNGTLQMALPLASAWVNAAEEARDWAADSADWPAAAVYALPWFYADADAALAAARAMHEASSACLGAGALRLGYLCAESYAMVNRLGPVTAPADIQGLRFGSAAADASLPVNRRLQATTRHYRHYEIAAALQEGEITAAAAPLPQIIAAGWTEYAPWLYLSGQDYQLRAITVNQDWYEALSPADRDILAAVTAALPERAAYYQQQQEAVWISALTATGADIQSADAAAKAAFRECMLPLYEDYARQYPQLFALAGDAAAGE